MTQHREQSSSTAPAARIEVPVLNGKAPRGMWWVAWRQHRLQIAVALGVMAAIAAAMLIFRELLIARFAAAGCRLPDGRSQCTLTDVIDPWQDGLRDFWLILRLAMMASPVVLGTFVGASIFPREFDQHTQIFALTQSVRRLRWWATKLTVAGVPLLLGLLALGLLVPWVDKNYLWTSGSPIGHDTFMVENIMPAAFGLLAFAIASTAGIVMRRVVASLITTLIAAGGAALLLGLLFYPQVVPATRYVALLAPQQLFESGYSELTAQDSLWVGDGYFDAHGQTVDVDWNACNRAANDAGNNAVGESDDPGATPDGVAPAGEDDDSRYMDAYDRAIDD